MSEEEWLSSADPLRMLEFLQSSGPASARKLRLFAVACSRRIWEWLDELSRTAVMVAAQFADGLATSEELRAARLACKDAGSNASWYAALSNPMIAARNAALSAQSGVPGGKPVQAALLRDIFGNPFRLVVIDLRWLTSTVVDLAHTIYEERAYDRLPILADVLMDAGCDSDDIIQHCRGEGPHVRGCWVIDLLLGKS